MLYVRSFVPPPAARRGAITDAGLSGFDTVRERLMRPPGRAVSSTLVPPRAVKTGTNMNFHHQ